MAVSTFAFTTGHTTLPDVGKLSYNGCVFSPLFETKVSGNPVKDKANRTVKCMEYEIFVDGYVTLPTGGAIDTTSVMKRLSELLTQQAGNLTYKGRGFDLVINEGNLKDVAWGPIPELLEFQPLGAGRSAKVRWVVRTSVTTKFVTHSIRNFPRGGGKEEDPGSPLILLQFNYDTTVGYGEDGFSSLSINGTLEIPMTRTPNQKVRTLKATADDLREDIESGIMSGIDLSRFRITNRQFDVSRDKRTLEWSITAEEKPYMDMPPHCTIARGTYSVKPIRVGDSSSKLNFGLATWACTLRATYTVRKDYPRRVAWYAFLNLLRLRMSQSTRGLTPKLPGAEQNVVPAAIRNPFIPAIGFGTRLVVEAWKKLTDKLPVEKTLPYSKAFLFDFTVEEGLYLDSKTTTFSATWFLPTVFSHILLASGVWKKLPEKTQDGENIWAVSMKDVSGAKSWLSNRVDPNLDVIVDFGGP